MCFISCLDVLCRGLALIIIAAIMLLLAFLGLCKHIHSSLFIQISHLTFDDTISLLNCWVAVFSILGMQFLVYILMIIGWILVTVTFILCGIFLALHKYVLD